VFGPPLAAERYLELMQHDKKVRDGQLRFVLLKDIGQAVVSEIAAASEVRRAILARSAHA